MNDRTARITKIRHNSPVTIIEIMAGLMVKLPDLRTSSAVIPINPSNAIKTDACIRCLRSPSFIPATNPNRAIGSPKNAGIAAVILAIPLMK
jgi:phosphoribosylcarboxyaminoimidazole (NCAIR) mutase